MINHQYVFTLANGTFYHICETRVQDFSGCESMQLRLLQWNGADLYQPKLWFVKFFLFWKHVSEQWKIAGFDLAPI